MDRLPEIYGLPGATMTLVLLSYPYVLLVVRSSIVNMDPAVEESARSLGKGPIRTLLTVTVPMLRPAIAAGSLLVALYVLSDFGAVLPYALRDVHVVDLSASTRARSTVR